MHTIQVLNSVINSYKKWCISGGGNRKVEMNYKMDQEF